ncbi:glycoside hydrolase family 16 protein, partial [Sphaerobolus stellatus SS14]
IIPSNSFSSYSVFENFWNYLYPWGSDHNGSARMVGNSSDHSHIAVASGTLSLIATPTSGAIPPTSSANPHPEIHYASGAIHAKSQITVAVDSGYQVEGEFIAPTALGTWPAFCLQAVQGWPPEVLRLIGTAQNWFNTFNTSSIVKSDIVDWPTDGNFHTLKAILTAADSVDVKIDFYLDNVLQATQIGAGFVGQAMWLIINLQMEGSSGSPGPTGTTTYMIRNVQLTQLT